MIRGVSLPSIHRILCIRWLPDRITDHWPAITNWRSLAHLGMTVCWDIQSWYMIATWAIYLGAWEVWWASIARRDAWCDGHPYQYYFDGISSYINYTVLTWLGHVGRATHLSRLSFNWGEYGIFYLLLMLLIVMYLSLNSYRYNIKSFIVRLSLNSYTWNNRC